MMRTFEDDRADEIYFRHLCDVANCHYDQLKLFRRLYETEFIFSSDDYSYMDSNRVADALAYRDRWIDEERNDYGISAPTVSILEVMIALAERLDEFYGYFEEMGDTIPRYVHWMIYNLGLENYTDNMFDARRVDDILRTFLNREYKRDGKGGLFYIPGNPIDMRKKEIWDQAMLYLNYVDMD